MRLFTAIPLDEEIKRKLTGIYRPISGLKWVSPENIHLTLKFIGYTRLHVANELMEALESVKFEPFDFVGCGQNHPGSDDAAPFVFE